MEDYKPRNQHVLNFHLSLLKAQENTRNLIEQVLVVARGGGPPRERGRGNRSKDYASGLPIGCVHPCTKQMV